MTGQEQALRVAPELPGPICRLPGQGASHHWVTHITERLAQGVSVPPISLAAASAQEWLSACVEPARLGWPEDFWVCL